MKPDYMTTISSIADVYDGPHATPKKLEQGPYFLSISSLEKGRLDLKKSAFLSENDFKKWTKRVTPKEGDLLFSYETRLGEVALMPPGIRACLGRRMGLLRLNREKVMPEYALYAYLSPAFQQTIKANTITGATVDRIALNELPNFPIRIPSIEEQKKVAKLLSEIDKKIELNNRINAELEAMAKTLYDYWFVQFDFPDDSPKGQGKPYKTSGGKMVYNRTLKREIPEGWEIAPIEKYFNYQEGPGITKEKYANEGHNFINIKCIQDNDLDVSNASKIADKFVDAYSHFQLDENDIVLSTSGTLGRLAIVRKVHLPLLLNTSVIRFKPRESYYFECLYCYLQSETFIGYLNQLATGSIQKNFGPTHLAQIFETFPSEELMIEFSKRTDPIVKKLVSLRSENDNLKNLRDWLLPMLMNGQVTVK